MKDVQREDGQQKDGQQDDGQQDDGQQDDAQQGGPQQQRCSFFLRADQAGQKAIRNDASARKCLVPFFLITGSERVSRSFLPHRGNNAAWRARCLPGKIQSWFTRG